MPLLPGKENIGRNISELTHHGSRPRSHAQIVAIALSNADRHPHRAAGGIGLPHVSVPHVKLDTGSPHGIGMGMAAPWWTRSAAHDMGKGGIGVHGHFAAGGVMSMGQASPWFERSEARIMDMPMSGSGLIGGSGAGRTDRLPLDVAADSHVVPADVVSGLGQGHSLAGARFLQAAMKTGPWGTPLPHAVHGHGPPHAPAVSAQMAGEASGGEVKRTSILAASGEMLIEPEDVEALGQRAHAQGLAKKGEPPMETGHRLIDEMIHHVRKFTIDWLKHAPPPKKSIGGAVTLEIRRG